MSCREDIVSADQAIEAVATLLHEVAPDGDVGAAADALRQVSLCCGSMYVCPAAQHKATEAALSCRLTNGITTARLTQT